MTPVPVVITGLGVLACNGIGRRAFWDALAAGKSGIRPLSRFDASEFPCRIAGELWDFRPEDFMSKRVVQHWHRHVHQAVASARLAVEDAGLAAAAYPDDRVAVAVGTSIGSPNEAYQEQVEALQSGGFRKVSKFASSAFSGHSATAHVSVDFGLRGPAITIASGCATGLDALAWGVNQIRLGNADAAVVGATESPLFPMSFATQCSLGILSRRNDEPEKAMRPFDRGRDGIVLSEGACTVVLERLDHARSRGARILAEAAGNGSAAEARNPLLLEQDGKALSRAARIAMREAGVAPGDIDHIQCHGVSIEMYDRCETNAYKEILGDRAYRVPISAAKSMVGQAYAVGGLFGVAGALLALVEDIVPPTRNLDDPDPRCDLDYVPHQARL
ncbi:MAG TPA: beta-ketoacyl-[acyl-carrier-protein] synthase family protein, partial [Candidatus Hydrogenedentes bacterium]|nr:beta-ketoacyl-[acyl-carrier-protein] synthase family protein [Candidatus Hydrogenedentota bacterium]